MQIYLFICTLLTLLHLFTTQLIVNVKNEGGDVYTEKMEANTTEDTILLNFSKADGTEISHFIDAKNEIHIFKAVILPEVGLGQTEIQTLCFVLRFARSEFIASDAMSKLRQKNPGTVRHPEETQPDEHIQLDILLDIEEADALSPYIASMCSEAKHTTYSRLNDIKLLAQILNRDLSGLESSPLLSTPHSLVGCAETEDLKTPCLCHYDVCVGWYPCGLKYCRGKDSTGNIVSYRCGIKTCGKCRVFEYSVSAMNECIWDFPDTEQSETENIQEELVGLGNDNEDDEDKLENSELSHRELDRNRERDTVYKMQYKNQSNFNGPFNANLYEQNEVVNRIERRKVIDNKFNVANNENENVDAVQDNKGDPNGIEEQR